jgi:hypothetical protein
MNQQNEGIDILRHRATRETGRYCPRSYTCPACGHYVTRNEDGAETAWIFNGPDEEPTEERHGDVCNG